MSVRKRKENEPMGRKFLRREGEPERFHDDEHRGLSDDWEEFPSLLPVQRDTVLVLVLALAAALALPLVLGCLGVVGKIGNMFLWPG